MYVIPALWRRRQEDEKFKVIFSYVATVRLAKVMRRSVKEIKREQ